MALAGLLIYAEGLFPTQCKLQRQFSGTEVKRLIGQKCTQVHNAISVFFGYGKHFALFLSFFFFLKVQFSVHVCLPLV